MVGMDDHTVRMPSTVGFDNVADLKPDERREVRDMNITYTESIHTDLSDRDIEGLGETVKCFTGLPSVEKACRHAKDTASVEFDDTLMSHEVDLVESRLQQWYGSLWTVRRKPDARRRDGKSRKSVVIRRVEARAFRYNDESEVRYKRMRFGTPDGIDPSASNWGDTDVYDIPVSTEEKRADLHVYPTPGGAQHLVCGSWPASEGFLYANVTEGTSTYCGLPISPEQLADPDTLTHYREVLKEATTISTLPEDTLPDLCQSCYRGWGDTITDDGTITAVREPKDVSLSALL